MKNQSKLWTSSPAEYVVGPFKVSFCAYVINAKVSSKMNPLSRNPGSAPEIRFGFLSNRRAPKTQTSTNKRGITIESLLLAYMKDLR